MSIFSGSFQLLQAEYNQPEIDEYKQIVSKLGNQVVLLKQIEEKENELKNKVFDVINQNKVYSSKIEKKIAQLSADFINYTYFSILFLLLIIGAFIIILGYKVYKNIGLSVDEIETKVQEGLEEIKNLNQEIDEEGVIQFLLKSFQQGEWRFNVPVLMAEYAKIIGWENIPAWNHPALFIRGGLSPYVQDKYRDAIASQFPQARAHVVAGTGHWVHAEKPDAVLRAVHRFIDEA